MNRKGPLTGNDRQGWLGEAEGKYETNCRRRWSSHKYNPPRILFSTLWFIGPQKPQRCNLQKCICWKSVHPERSVSFVCFNGTLSLLYDCLFMVHSSFPSFSIPSLRHSFIINALFFVTFCPGFYGWVIKGALLLINDRFMHSVSLFLAGQYFASIMIIVGMSVIATVVVLQYHHHDPNGGTMPKWVRTHAHAYTVPSGPNTTNAFIFPKAHFSTFTIVSAAVIYGLNW